MAMKLAPHYMAPMGRLDHLIPSCPSLLKEARHNAVIANERPCLDPDGEGVCRWCARVWKARNL